MDPSYFTLSITQNTVTKTNEGYEIVETDLGYKLWDSLDLPGLGQEYVNRAIEASVYWPVNKKYKLAGNYLSKNYN